LTRASADDGAAGPQGVHESEGLAVTNGNRLPWLLVCITLLTGCATSKVYVLGEDLVPRKTNFELIDKRDEIQKKAEIMSLSITNCWYGIYRLGDEQLVPDRLAALSRALEDLVGSKLSGKQVIINRFEIFNNMQSAVRGTGGGDYSVEGLVRSAIIANGCEAAFALDGNPANLPAVIVNLDVEVGGKTVKDKVVQLEPQGQDTFVNGPFATERVKRAVDAAIMRVVEAASR